MQPVLLGILAALLMQLQPAYGGRANKVHRPPNTPLETAGLADTKEAAEMNVHDTVQHESPINLAGLTKSGKQDKSSQVQTAVNRVPIERRLHDELGLLNVPSLSDHQAASSEQLRIVACVHLKNELPYLVEWLEFHRLMGFSHFIIYDDFSSDDVGLLEALYKEHGREYITVLPPMGHGLDNRGRRSHNAGHCSRHFSNLSDWMINIDVDEFVWSPAHRTIQEYLAAEVSESMHMVYVGATRFGWAGQRHRFAYSLRQVNSTSDHRVELVNPHGVQLLTNTHVLRAPEQRFGEPEQLLRESNARCREWAETEGDKSPCTNDYNGRYGKTFVRTQHMVSVWTHGGGVRGPFGEGSVFDGSDVGTERCPHPICMRADPAQVHISHLRSPSIADVVKKNLDEGLSSPEEAQTRMQVSDEAYEAETWFFNQIRDVSLAKFADRLAERIEPLLTPM